MKVYANRSEILSLMETRKGAFSSDRLTCLSNTPTLKCHITLQTIDEHQELFETVPSKRSSNLLRLHVGHIPLEKKGGR
jgi:hypothetical protein